MGTQALCRERESKPEDRLQHGEKKEETPVQETSSTSSCIPPKKQRAKKDDCPYGNSSACPLFISVLKAKERKCRRDTRHSQLDHRLDATETRARKNTPLSLPCEPLKPAFSTTKRNPDGSSSPVEGQKSVANNIHHTASAERTTGCAGEGPA